MDAAFNSGSLPVGISIIALQPGGYRRGCGCGAWAYIG